MILLTAALVLQMAAKPLPNGSPLGVAPETILAFALNENRALDPSAIHKNTDGSVDIGLMQINSANLTRLHISDAAARNPLVSIRAAAIILKEDYGTCLQRHVGVAALRCMGSYYNTGTPGNGITNGYVPRLFKIAETISVPALVSSEKRVFSPPSSSEEKDQDDDGGEFHDSIVIHQPHVKDDHEKPKY